MVRLSKTSSVKENKFNNSLKKSFQNLSVKLSLPTNVDLNLSNLSFNKTMLNSWFSVKGSDIKSTKIKSKKISVNSIENEEITRQMKFKLKMNSIFKNKMKHALYATNFVYNQCVDYVNKGNKVSQKILRDLLINSETKNNTNWEEVPYDIKDEAIRDFMKAFCLQGQLVKDGTNQKFKMKHRKRKVNRTFVINSKHVRIKEEDNIQKFYGFPKLWNKEYFTTFTERIPTISIEKKTKKKTNLVEKLPHDFRMEVSRTGNIFLILPVDKETNTDCKKKKFVCSLDPGVKIFQTTYDIDGNSMFVGENDIHKLSKLKRIAYRMREGIARRYKKEDGVVFRKYYNVNKIIERLKLKETSDSTKHKIKKMRNKKRKLKLVACRMETKIKNKRSDLHRKTSKFLCENYKNIIIPSFEVQKMVKKKDRNIGNKTSDQMMIWSHYKFRQLLIAKGEELNSNIIVGTEEFTSKTCGNCFYINSNLKGERIFQCPNCKYTIHRDLNAARNILILNWSKIKN